MQKTSLILLGLALTAMTTVLAQGQNQQQQHQQQQQGPGPAQNQGPSNQPPLGEEEYYDEEPLPIEQEPAVGPATPPPPPPPVARPVSSLFSRPSASPSAGRQTPVQRHTTTTAAPEPDPIPVAPAHVPSRTRPESASTSVTAPATNEFFECPEKFGFFPHHRSCDKYWKCEEGQGTLKICGNGLIFDVADQKRESCNYPFAADCGDRTELEPPQSTEFCPRLYGIFADEADCRIFWSCWGGESKRYECAPGLAFDETNRVCTWADKVTRCLKKEVAEGFTCPDGNGSDQAGTYTRHGHPEDCRKFFVCIENTPRMYGCELGTVFNLETLQCDEPASVPGCEDYYGDLDLKTLKKAQLSGFSHNAEKKLAAARGASQQGAATEAAV